MSKFINNLFGNTNLIKSNRSIVTTNMKKKYICDPKIQSYASAARNAQTNEELSVICENMDIADRIFLGKVDLWFAKVVLSTTYRTLKSFPCLRGDMHYVGTLNGFIKNKDSLFLEVNGASAAFVSGMVKTATDNVALNCRTAFENGGLATAFYAGVGDKYLSGIIINGKSFNQRDVLRNIECGEMAGFHPQGCKTVKYVIDHELGHMMDRLTGIEKCREFKDLMSKHDLYSLSKGLSNYCVSDGTIHYPEVIADAYAEFCNNPKPREIASSIGHLIVTKYFDKFN